jgi:hypothetical protein
MRIAFMGASGTGKTTLAKWVSETYGLPINPVGSRSVAKAMGFESPYDVDKAGRRVEFQHRLQAEKMAWELKHESFVTDRTTIDELAYLSIHNIDGVSADYYGRAFQGWSRYDVVFHTPVEAFIDLAGDPSRRADVTYHMVFDAMVRGFLLFPKPPCPTTWFLHKPDLSWRKNKITVTLNVLP